MAGVNKRLWAQAAWLDGRWREHVVFEIDAQGHWLRFTPDQAAPADAERIDAPVLPPLVNAHSHAFQRAFVGLAERRDTEHDDFWSWRDRMYGVALRITPEQLRAVAAHLYAELLAGGYTQVCEFHYLHHAPDGARYADPAAMAQALADAAAEVGIGLTLLPVLYERAGFTQPTLRADQRRFATTVADVLAMQSAGAAMGAHVNAGVAVHSLRAARPESIVALAEASSGPLHIHVAEQTGEVDECLAATGCRPIEWLTQHAPLDQRWQLVHATHTLPEEIDAVAARGAGVVLCPSTEANLGDGLPDLPRWLAAGVPLTVGSDSQVVRAWPEELRWLEYGQRLTLRQRNVAAAPSHEPSTAARLIECMQAGSAAAAGLPRWGFEPGARADLLVLDVCDDALVGLPASYRLDGLVFAAPARPFARVLVAGCWRVADLAGIAQRYAHAMRALSRDGG
jgi:formimidoylglutamate deiminase